MMENLIALLVFFAKLLLLMFVVGFPLLLIVVFLADKIYRKVAPKYEELREKRIKELEGKKKDDKNHKFYP
ncbi:MAG: hypothetical protein D6699_02165 [Aquificota bacterium]|nr:MAG: hypothetical protein D6699_02165 [Aquificota bacterium]